ILSIAGAVIAIISFVIARMGDARKNEHRLTLIEGDLKLIRFEVETKLAPVWNAIMTELPKLLISERTPELDKLLNKHLTNNNPLTDTEKTRTIELLGIEIKRAVEDKNIGRATTLLLVRSGFMGLRS
ncbi:unnamed protein product, partial [marine sediment metagenome]